ncbi:uncharacterized protein SPAPADRAFT_60876 [Spathaspora passalidarum NRRL Y-27907]|uniref:PCI domain-containing protein n=1 Tax=Spathaspora passalidarum (strain NRRL Y-27907 / 11-Y1) TaxID=619300 RepID=G3AMT8_SPAPN|nr:uncharacterized protein SPAPADRAFT_60876 [Spathaspora passalidarum NRRL Y-27907]EGW33532.1 hypothetical protein SPAPADRAFT_60876 [Spathaspora passalidarum NRRL Y-27907]
MDLDNDVSTILAILRSETESPELINVLYQLEDFYERKLWHQLTQVLDEFYYQFDKSLVTPTLKFKIYSLFITQFQSKLNPIKVVDFLLESFSKPEETSDKLLELKQEFLTQIKKENNFKDDDEEFKKVVDEDESIIYVDLQIARYYLILSRLNDSEDILSRLSPKFESTTNDLNSKINAAYYLTKCEYCQITENYNDYYKNGLLYLSSVPNLTEEDKVKICYQLCIAALLGDRIYNFGELILHDILSTIESESSQYNWLYHLIQDLNSGNLQEFNKWLSVGFQRSPMLVKFELFLKQKIIIMALLELISQTPTTNKQLTFQEISDFTSTPLNDVEHLIIKCFSLNLIQGYINQIDQVLNITWLQPRILNLTQVKTLYNHLVDWDNKVDNLAKTVYQNGGTVWAGL